VIVYPTRGLMFAALVVLAGCGDTDAANAAGAAHSAVDPAGSATAAALAPATAAAATARAAGPLSESDRMQLSTAASACKAGDPKAFFDSFIQSAAVQRKYTAPMIDVSLHGADHKLISKQRVAAASYRDFPIMMQDYYRKPTTPLRAGDQDEYVEIEVNQSQTNRISVEWARVHYDGKSEGGDDLGNALNADGTAYERGQPGDGQLLFAPTADCWQLVADIRTQR